MKSLIYVFLLGLMCWTCEQKTKSTAASQVPPFAIVIHGGAGTILKSQMTPEQETAYMQILGRVVDTGYAILASGGKSIDAVEAAINIMEDSPLFNAGKGAVFTHEETNALDASIMEGRSLNAGAVAGVSDIKHPISAARRVMTHSPHVMLAGKGASQFAAEQGLQLVDPSYFYTDRRFKALQKVKAKEMKAQNLDSLVLNDPLYKTSKYGTVGCVALDQYGDLVAGTSTGGMTNKRWERIGDAPIIGAGTYANNSTCAVSSTGWGEFFIRGVVAHDIAALIDYKGLSLDAAAHEVIHRKLTKMGGTGGIIAIDYKGNVATTFNTEGMYRAYRHSDGQRQIAIYSSE